MTKQDELIKELDVVWMMGEVHLTKERVANFIISRETKMLDEFKKDKIIINKDCLYRNGEPDKNNKVVEVYGVKYIPTSVLDEIEKQLTPLMALQHHSVDEELWRIKESLSTIQKYRGDK